MFTDSIQVGLESIQSIPIELSTAENDPMR